MAGVGFSLRSLSTNGSYLGLARLYGAAGLISSGPWLLSILTLLFVGVLGRSLDAEPQALERFQVSVTWLFAGSLLWTGPLQLMFTRFAADREFLGESDRTLPNLIGALACCGAASAALFASCAGFFAGESLGFLVVLGAAFVALSQVWLVVIVLAGLRAHWHVLGSFALGYALTFAACLPLARFGEVGLLGGFAIGQAALLFAALYVLYTKLPASSTIAFGFARREALYLELGLIGFFYNLAVWVDKLIFWWNPHTGRSVIGPFSSSEVYDLPIFLAYLTIVPGMAVFLVRVETDFAEAHAAYYAAVRGGAPLRRIEGLCEALTDAARRAIGDILRVQLLTVLLCTLVGPQLLRFSGISELHLPLFYIDAAGVALQVLLMAITSMFFYLDQRRAVAKLTGFLLCSNAALTCLTQQLGPDFYGYGFAGAMALTSLIGLLALSRAFTHLVRDTFMLQPVAT